MFSTITKITIDKIVIDETTIKFVENNPIYIIGKNGCGKTRFVKLIKNIFNNMKNIGMSNKQLYANYRYQFNFMISFNFSFNKYELSRSTFEIKKVKPIERTHEFLNDCTNEPNNSNCKLNYAYNKDDNKITIIFDENDIFNCAKQFNENPVKKNQSDFFSSDLYLSDNDVLNYSIQFVDTVNEKLVFHFIDNTPKLNRSNYNDVRKNMVEINKILNSTFDYFKIHILDDININYSNEINELIYMYKKSDNTYIALNYSDTSSSFQTIVYYLFLLFNNINNRIYFIDEFDQQLDKNTLANIFKIFGNENNNNQIVAILQNSFSITSQIKNYYISYDYLKLKHLDTGHNGYTDVNSYREFLLGDYKKFIIVEGEIDTYLIKSLYKTYGKNPDELCIIQADSKYKIKNLINFLNSIEYFTNMITHGIRILLVYDIDNNLQNINKFFEEFVKNNKFNCVEHDKNLEDHIKNHCAKSHCEFLNQNILRCNILSNQCTNLKIINCCGEVKFNDSDKCIEFNNMTLILTHKNIKITSKENINMSFLAEETNNQDHEIFCKNCIIKATNNTKFKIEILDDLSNIQIFWSGDLEFNKYNDKKNNYKITHITITSCNIIINNKKNDRSIYMNCYIDKTINIQLKKLIYDYNHDINKIKKDVDDFVKKIGSTNTIYLDDINQFKTNFNILNEFFVKKTKNDTFKDKFKNQLRKYVIDYNEKMLSEKVFCDCDFKMKYHDLNGIFELPHIQKLRSEIINL